MQCIDSDKQCNRHCLDFCNKEQVRKENMNIVKQRSKYDCALAVLSMLSGKPYEEIFDKEFSEKIELATTCTDDDLVEAYRRAGFIKDQNMKVIYCGHNNVNVSLIRQMLWGRRAMIQVPSLNIENSEHFIYWDGKQIFDPSNNQTYKYLQHIFPTYITLIDEFLSLQRQDPQ